MEMTHRTGTDGARVLALSGDFDGRSTAEVRDALHHLIDVADGDVVVDLSEVTSTDLLALRVLAAATRRAAGLHIHVVLRGARPAVRRLLHLSHLIRAVEVEPAPAAAGA